MPYWIGLYYPTDWGTGYKWFSVQGRVDVTWTNWATVVPADPTSTGKSVAWVDGDGDHQWHLRRKDHADDRARLICERTSGTGEYY